MIYLIVIGCGMGLSMIFLYDFENKIFEGKRTATYNSSNYSASTLYSTYLKHPIKIEVIHMIYAFCSIVLTSLFILLVADVFFMLGFATILAYLQRDSLKSIEKIIRQRENTRITTIAEGMRLRLNQEYYRKHGDMDYLLEQRIDFLMDSNRGESRLYNEEVLQILELLAKQNDDVGAAAHQMIEKMKSSN